jgi:HTH-type transcriptional regulator / antitoxin HigA
VIGKGALEWRTEHEVTAFAPSREYRTLLYRVAPRVIRTEDQNAGYKEILRNLDQQRRELSAAETELAELLTVLIEDFEEKHHQLPRSTPQGTLRFLMDQHSLMQKDLVDVFGAASIVSEVLNGKRELNKDQIRRLSRRFHVSPELFF